MVANRVPKHERNIYTMSRIKSKKYNGVYLNKLVDGDISYSITYKNENGNSQRFTVGKKSQGITEVFCKNKRDEILNKIRLGEDPLSHKKKKQVTTIDDIARIYFNQSIHNKDNRKTYNKYTSKLKKKFGNKNIASITSDQVFNYQLELIKQGLAPSTINFDITFLGTLYNIAIEEKLFDGIIPTKTKKLKKLKVDNKRERYLTTDEINSLLDRIEDEHIKLFVQLSLLTGGRLETILNIQKKDVDLTNGVITLKDLKNDSTYKGFINPSIINNLKSILKDMEPNTFIIGNGNIKYATRTCQRKLQNILNELFNKGLDSKDSKNRVVIHTLRHTFASHLAINGTPIFTVQKLMNHNDIKMTLRYAKLAPDSGKDFINELYK